MAAIIARSLEALVDPSGPSATHRRGARGSQKRHYGACPIYDRGRRVRRQPRSGKPSRRFDGSADVCEMRVAAQEAVQPVRRAIERRLLDARLLGWAIRELPWSRTDRDEARIRRECAEILAELPLDFTEPEGKEALEPTVREACAEIEQRQAEKERQARKAILILQGVAEVRATCWS